MMPCDIYDIMKGTMFDKPKRKNDDHSSITPLQRRAPLTWHIFWALQRSNAEHATRTAVGRLMTRQEQRATPNDWGMPVAGSLVLFLCGGLPGVLLLYSSLWGVLLCNRVLVKLQRLDQNGLRDLLSMAPDGLLFVHWEAVVTTYGKYTRLKGCFRNIVVGLLLLVALALIYLVSTVDQLSELVSMMSVMLPIIGFISFIRLDQMYNTVWVVICAMAGSAFNPTHSRIVGLCMYIAGQLITYITTMVGFGILSVIPLIVIERRRVFDDWSSVWAVVVLVVGVLAIYVGMREVALRLVLHWLLRALNANVAEFKALLRTSP
jgi:hypothetical protein